MNYYDFAPTSAKKSIEDNFNSIRWTPLTSRILSKLYDISPISFSCNSSDGRHIDQVYFQKGSEEFKFFETIRPVNLESNKAPVDRDLRGYCPNEDYNFYD